MEIVTSFPEGFLWGAATSAYQCEGAAEGYGKKDNQQDVINREIHDEYGYADASVASDHYHHYKEDVALMAEMGFSSYRFSINWHASCPMVWANPTRKAWNSTTTFCTSCTPITSSRWSPCGTTTCRWHW